MKRHAGFVCLLLAAGVFAGCNTPASRIERNMAFFNTLPAQDRALIEQGKVGVGFTAEMVELALGRPDRVYSRTDALGQSESWVYTTWGARGGGAVYYRGGYHRHHRSRYLYWMDFDDREELERFKVTLKDGKVTVIEEMDRP